MFPSFLETFLLGQVGMVLLWKNHHVTNCCYSEKGQKRQYCEKILSAVLSQFQELQAYEEYSAQFQGLNLHNSWKCLHSQFQIFSFISKMSTWQFYFIFSPPASFLVSLMLLRVRQTELFNRICGHKANADVWISWIGNRFCSELGSWNGERMKKSSSLSWELAAFPTWGGVSAVVNEGLKASAWNPAWKSSAHTRCLFYELIRGTTPIPLPLVHP